MSQNTTESIEFAPSAEPASSNGGRLSAESIDERIARPGRSRWSWLLAGAALGACVTWVVSANVGDETAVATTAQETVQLSTVAVETRDLVEEVEWSGTLAAGRSAIVTAAGNGIVTSAVGDGTTIERGDVIAVIGAEPLVALYGDVPMWRDLSEGDTGADVLQLEINLVELGFDPAGAVMVDDEYTSATAGMVGLWEESLGLDNTGRVPRSRIAVLDGPSTVSDGAVVGSPTHADAQLAVLETLAQTIDVVGWHDEATDELPGAITSIAPVGTPIEHGTALYSVDGMEVVALVRTDPVTDAVLAAFDSGDVEQIENVLVFLGFDPDGAIAVDDEIDVASVAAVQRWQASVGLPTTGSTNPLDYVLLTEVADSNFAVDTQNAAVGDALGEGRVVLGISTPTLSVTGDVAVSEVDQFAVGDVVRVVQLDESEFTAVVSEIADVASGTATGQNAEPTVAVTFDVTDAPDRYISGAVTIVTESSRIDGAIVVPTRALVTLSEGGFAVEVADADGTHLVGVELGVFDDGSVEITNGAVQPGDLVVVPS